MLEVSQWKENVNYCVTNIYISLLYTIKFAINFKVDRYVRISAADIQYKNVWQCRFQCIVCTDSDNDFKYIIMLNNDYEIAAWDETWILNILVFYLY